MEHTKEVEILFIIAARYGFSKERIQSDDTHRDVTDIRRWILYLLRKSTRLSTKAIGRLLNRNHSTICVQTTTHESLLQGSKEYRDNFTPFYILFKETMDGEFILGNQLKEVDNLCKISTAPSIK